MKRAVATTIAIVLGASAVAAQTTAPKKMAQSECQSIWNRADSSKSGALTSTQAQSYISDFKTADTNNDGKLSSTEFMAACDKGLVHDSASTGGSAGTSGSKK